MYDETFRLVADGDPDDRRSHHLADVPQYLSGSDRMAMRDWLKDASAWVFILMVLGVLFVLATAALGGKT